jgi:hypothetical protein
MGGGSAGVSTRSEARSTAPNSGVRRSRAPAARPPSAGAAGAGVGAASTGAAAASDGPLTWITFPHLHGMR